MSEQLVWTEEEAAEMKERFQRRFGEPLPRTESLFAVAAVGYRKGLNTRPSPTEIEALRAEVERLRTDLAESDEIREKLGYLLTLTAAALKGEPPAGVWHSWHDLPEKAAQLAERVQRDEALLRQVLEELSRALQTAMEQTLKARIPECAEFAGIAQDLDFVVDALRGRLGLEQVGHEYIKD